MGRQLVHNRAAWIGQSDEFGHLVEGLSRGIVERLTQHAHVVGRIHTDELGVTPAHCQTQKRKSRRVARLQHVGEDVCAHVVHGNGWDVQRPGHGLGKRCPDMQRPLKTWTEGVGDRIELRFGHVCLLQCRLDDRLDFGQMRTGSPLRDDPAHLGVQGLVGHNVAQHLRPSNDGS